MSRFRKSFDTFEDVIIVSHDNMVSPGLIELQIAEKVDDEIVNLAYMQLDHSQINGLIAALTEAKRLSETEYDAEELKMVLGNFKEDMDLTE